MYAFATSGTFLTKGPSKGVKYQILDVGYDQGLRTTDLIYVLPVVVGREADAES
jgi:hypothetical protein